MGYKQIILVIIWLLYLGDWSFGQTTFDPLAIGIGARALGMGGAYVAVAEDGDTVFNNPAGLGEIDTVKFTSMTGTLLEDVRYTVLGGIYPLENKSALGIGYAGAFVSGIELRDGYGILSRRANYGNSTAFLVFGKKLSEKISVGAGLKYYFIDGTEIDSGDGNGWNADFGIFSQGLDWLSLGLVGQNLISSGKINYQNGGSESLPMKVKAGTKIYLLGSGFNAAVVSPMELSLAVDTHFDFQEAKSMTIHYGMEFSPSSFLTVRAGSDQNNLTAGLSLRFAGLGFHYAYHPYGEFISGSYFSITFDERGWPPEGPSDVFLGSQQLLGCKESPLVLK